MYIKPACYLACLHQGLIQSLTPDGCTLQSFLTMAQLTMMKSLLSLLPLLAGTISLLATTTHAANPFTSNVIELTPKNWKEEVLDSPHAVFVSFAGSRHGRFRSLSTLPDSITAHDFVFLRAHHSFSTRSSLSR